jgi:glycosyltransferase involved in cell wall biosynthesis
MRVLIISGEDLAGGGHRAAFRLHQALRGIGVESFMAVRRKHSSDPYVHKMTVSELGWPPVGRGYLDSLPSFLYRRKDEPISLGLQSANLGKLVKRFKPDVVNLHWINAGIASIHAIGNLQVPAVWTLHDMWPFTGGCHYSGECTQYRASCGKCPKIKSVLNSPSITRWVYERKRKQWSHKPLHAITPSAWMQKLALTSSLFSKEKVTHIRNCVDPTVFNAASREQTRADLGLSPTTKAVLFSSADQPRKGAVIIPEVIRILRYTTPQKDWRFLFMGGAPPALEICRGAIILPRTTNEARVASYYAASDLYALPSLEDNLPNTVSESMCCGTPVAAFPTGGIVEMIEDGHSGYLSYDCSAQSLAMAILECEDGKLAPRDIISKEAHNTYSMQTIAEDHRALFRRIVAFSEVRI